MRLLLASLVAAAALAGVAGCGGNVVVDPAATSSGGLGGGGNGGAGAAGDGGSGGGSVSPTGGPVSPGYAVVSGNGVVDINFASQPITCQNPGLVPSGCGWWLADIAVPEEMFVVGAIDLSSPQVKFFVQESDGGPDPNSCGSAVGGGGLPGTLIIHSISATQAQLELQGVSTYLLDGNADGVYLAPICN